MAKRSLRSDTVPTGGGVLKSVIVWLSNGKAAFLGEDGLVKSCSGWASCGYHSSTFDPSLTQVGSELRGKIQATPSGKLSCVGAKASRDFWKHPWVF